MSSTNGHLFNKVSPSPIIALHTGNKKNEDILEESVIDIILVKYSVEYLKKQIA